MQEQVEQVQGSAGLILQKIIHSGGWQLDVCVYTQIKSGLITTATSYNFLELVVNIY